MVQCLAYPAVASSIGLFNGMAVVMELNKNLYNDDSVIIYVREVVKSLSILGWFHYVQCSCGPFDYY